MYDLDCSESPCGNLLTLTRLCGATLALRGGKFDDTSIVSSQTHRSDCILGPVPLCKDLQRRWVETSRRCLSSYISFNWTTF